MRGLNSTAIVEVRSCRALAEPRHAPSMVLILLSYGFDDRRISKAIRGGCLSSIAQPFAT